jgi:RPA family protein
MVNKPPAKEKSISEITPDDTRVRIIGVVVDIGENYIVVDDGTGKLEIFAGEYSNLKEEFKNLKIGDLIKIFVRIYGRDTENLRAIGEAFQIVNGLDIKLYKETKKIIENIGVVQDV